MTRSFFLSFILLLSPYSFAGLSETGFSANIRLSQVDADNSQKTTSFTASYAYYFWELSALEFSYTNGRSQLDSRPNPADAALTIKTFFELYGLDLVLGFGSKSGPLTPYAKLGIAYLEKEIFRDVQGLGGGKLAKVDGLVPSAGAGIKYKYSKRWIFKTGIDAWTTPLDEDDITVDYAARFGVSWLY